MSTAYTFLALRHLAAKREVILPVRVNNFLMDTRPNWGSSEVYGRMDPIFTYQNTKRTFQITCQTVMHSELDKVTIPIIPGAGDNAAKKVIDTYKGTKKNPSAGSIDYAAHLREQISKIYKFMYPVYEDKSFTIRNQGATTDMLNLRMSQLRAPPLLKIIVPNVFASSKEGNPGSYIFVPETWSLSTGLADARANQMTITSPGQMKYLAPLGSYGFTLGGTILHTVAPGWRLGSSHADIEYQSDGSVDFDPETSDHAHGVFAPVGFPFGSGVVEDPDKEDEIIKILEDNTGP